jgi:hypothetical protein
MQLDHVHRERGCREEREARPYQARRERVEDQDRRGAEDGGEREHQVIATEPSRLGEEHAEQVRELEMHVRLAADGRRAEVQVGYVMERARVGPEGEAVVRGQPPARIDVGAGVAVDHHVLAGVGDVHDGRTGRQRDRAKRRHRRRARRAERAGSARRAALRTTSREESDRCHEPERNQRHGVEQSRHGERETHETEAGDHREERGEPDLEPAGNRRRPIPKHRIRRRCGRFALGRGHRS